MHPIFPFHPSFIKLFYLEDEFSSNIAYANHSFIRGAEECAFPILFSTGFVEKIFSKCF